MRCIITSGVRHGRHVQPHELVQGIHGDRAGPPTPKNIRRLAAAIAATARPTAFLSMVRPARASGRAGAPKILPT